VPAAAPQPVAPAPAQPVKQAAAPARPAAPAQVAARPVRPAATPAPAPAEAELQPVKVDGSITSNVRQMIVTILAEAAKPMPFNSIYAKLQASGIELPAEKPMLVVRKLLHNKELFDVVKGGMFQLHAEEDAASLTQAAPAAAPSPAPAEPAPAAPQPAAPAPALPVQPAAAPAPAAQPQAAAARPTVVSTTPTPVQPVRPNPQQPAAKPASSFSSRLDAILNQ